MKIFKIRQVHEIILSKKADYILLRRFRVYVLQERILFLTRKIIVLVFTIININHIDSVTRNLLSSMVITFMNTHKTSVCFKILL